MPHIKNSHALDFSQFLRAYNDLVRKSRTNQLEIADFQGTTISLTNPGMIGTVASVPRLMKTQGAIIATGQIGSAAEGLGSGDLSVATAVRQLRSAAPPHRSH